MARVLGDRGALAVAVLRRGEHALCFVFGHQHRDHMLARVQSHAAYAARIASHRAHIVFIEAHRLAAVGKQHHVVFAVGQCGTHQHVTFVQINGDDAGLARVAEVVERGLLHRSQRGRHEDIVVGRETAELARQGQHHVDLLFRLQREHVDDGLAARVARALRHFPDLEPIDPALVGEAQDPVVRVGNEELVYPVVFLGLCRLFAAAAPALRAVFADRLALDVAGVAERDDDVGRRDQILSAQLLHVVFDDAAARGKLALAELFAQGAELARDDRRHAIGARQDVQQVGDLLHHLAVLGNDLVLLEAGEALQAHLQDFLRLVVRQAV